MTEKMKPSGIAWIGHIPNEWGCKQIAFMADSRSGGTPDRNNLTYWENGTIPWMSSGEVNKVNVYETDEKITELATRNSSAKIVKANAVMVALNGQGKTKGMSAILRIDSACNQSLCAFSCHEGILHYEYLFWCFQTMYTYLRQMSGDDVRDGLAASYVKKQKIPVPEYEEQCAIADFLDTQCAKIDSVIADIEKQIETLQKYKKSMITEAVTKGLDQSVPMKDSGIDWIGKIPSHWRVIRITKYLDSLVDYRGKTPEKVDDGVFLVTARNIKNGIVDYSLSQEYVAAEEYEQIMHRGKPEIGDVLFTTEAPLGEVANVDRTDIALAQRVIKFRGRKGCVDNYYLKYWLMSLGFQSFLWSLATGSTALGIAASKLGQLKMVLPPIDEQKTIAERLDCDCTNIDAIIVEKRKQLETAQQYKKSLICEYVTGKKRVTEVN